MESILDFILENSEIETLDKARSEEAYFYLNCLIKRESNPKKKAYYKQMKSKLQMRLKEQIISTYQTGL